MTTITDQAYAEALRELDDDELAEQLDEALMTVSLIRSEQARRGGGENGGA